MPLFKVRDSFDRVFEVSILLKAINGILEIAGGILMFFISPAKIIDFVSDFTQYDISANHHDFIARHILLSAHNLTSGSLIFGAIYLLFHGIAKIILIIEILREHLWAYIGLIVLTAAFIIYQVYRISYTHSIALTLLTFFDVFIIYITSKEYKKQRIILQKPGGESVD
jgi:uncharacterized membrane protein